MLAGEITNMRNAMYTRYTYFIMFLYICAKRRGNSLQISHWVRPGPCAVTCVCAPVVIIGPVAGLKINFFGIRWISFRVGSVPVRINIVPRQKDEQCRPQDEQKMRLGCLTSLTLCCLWWTRQVKSSLFLSLHSAHLYLCCSFLSVAMALVHVEQSCQKEHINPVFDSWWAFYLRNDHRAMLWCSVVVKLPVVGWMSSAALY